MPRGGKGLIIHTEAYDAPDNPFRGVARETPTLTCFHCDRVLPTIPPHAQTTAYGTLLCRHCAAEVVPHPQRTRARGTCGGCKGYICDRCVTRTVCPYQQHFCWNCDAYICEECKTVATTIGCHPFSQTIDLAMRYPKENISSVRPYGMPLAIERELATRHTPHQGITLPVRPTPEYGVTHMGSAPVVRKDDD